WERQSDEQRARLRQLFRLNGKLARAYQLVEELRAVLRAPDGRSLHDGLWRILRRTERRDNPPMRKLHESIKEHFQQIGLFVETRVRVRARVAASGTALAARDGVSLSRA